MLQFSVLKPPQDVLGSVATDAEVKAVHLTKAPLPDVRVDEILKRKALDLNKCNFFCANTLLITLVCLFRPKLKFRRRLKQKSSLS